MREYRPKITPQPEPPSGVIVIRQYEDMQAFQTDASSLAESGYFPVTMTNQPQRAGAWRIILLWFIALLWQPAPRLIVTYRRED